MKRDLDDEIDMEHLDARWDQLAAGELSAEEAAALAESDPAAAIALAPLGSGFARRIRAELAVIPPPRVPQKPRRRWWPWLPRLVAVMAAVMVVRLGYVASTPSAEPPVYRLIARPGDLPERSLSDSDPDEVMAYSIGSRMRLILRPRTQPDSSTQVVVFTRGPDGWAPMDLDVSSSNGAHRLGGIVGEDLALASGPHTLLIGVGPAGPVSTLERAIPIRGWHATFSEDTLDAAAEEPPPQWTFWKREVIISER
ncbi:MAG: hypothetical protein ACI8RZ_000191 [Myxococcota bacterium]|jgi:hypothetical protein